MSAYRSFYLKKTSRVFKRDVFQKNLQTNKTRRVVVFIRIFSKRSRVFKDRLLTGYEKSKIFHSLFQNLKQKNKIFKPCLKTTKTTSLKKIVTVKKIVTWSLKTRLSKQTKLGRKENKPCF